MFVPVLHSFTPVHPCYGSYHVFATTSGPIALRYFLARELQQRGQLRLAYVASEANTADIFTKALAPDCVVFLLSAGFVATHLTPGGVTSGHGSAQRSGSGGGPRQQQQRSSATLSPQQLREWYAARQRGGGTGPCTYVLRTGDRTGEQCGGPHSTQRCFGRLTDAWRHQFPNATEIPRWGELSRAGVAIFDLDYDAILAAMYAVSYSAEGDCYLCVPPDPGIEAAALGTGEAAALGASASAPPGAGESDLSGTSSAQAFHTFTLDSGASRSFFRDRTTLTPLSRPVAVSLADPSGGPVLASFSTVLPCPAAPSGTLSGLYLPSFSTNLVSGADLQDRGVDQFTPAGQRVTHCTCARTGRHLATFTRRPGSSLYTLTTASPPVAESGQTLLWHHCLGHPSLPRLRGMASRVLRAAPHSFEFPPTKAPLQTLHMDVWGPARVRGQGHERYFLLVIDDYSRYTMVFPLRSKGDVTEVLIDWIRAARLQLRESFGSDFPVLRLHSDRGGEFSSACLGAFCRAQGIRQTFTLPASPQKNGIVERRIGMVMDVARTSMIHAAAPHFLWPFAVQYAAHQLNLQPRVSLPETSPTLRWMGKVGDASAFRDVTFDESVPYYRLFPYRIAPLPPPPLFLAPGPPPVDPLPPQGRAPSGVSQVDAVEPVEVAVDSDAARGAEPAGAGSGGTEPEGAETGGAESRGAEPGGAESEGAESGGAEPGGAESGGAGSGGAKPWGAEPGGARSTRVASHGTSSRRELLSPQELREWFAWRWSHAAGVGGTTVAAGSEGTRTGGTGAAGAGGAAEAAGVGPARDVGAGAAGAGAAGVVGAGGSAGVGTSEGAGVGAVGARGAAGAAAEGTGTVPTGSGACPQPVPSQSQLQPATPFPAPSPYTGPTGGLAERREPTSRPVSPVRAARTSRRAPRSRPPAVPGTHPMALRPSTAPLRVPLPSPPESSLPILADPESDSLRATSPTVTRLLATVVTDPSFESTAASALVTELVDFAAHCRLDYATSLVAESASVYPPSVGDPDAPDIPTPRSYAEEIEGPYSSQWQAAMDAEMASWKSTGTYVDQIPPPGANIVLQRFDFMYSSPQATPLSTRHSLSALPSDESVERSGPYPELVGCLMYLMTCTRPDLAYPLSILARYVAPGRHRPEHMAAAKRVLRYLCSTSGLGLVLGGRRPVVLTGHADASSCEAEIYAGAMAAQELRWLTYLLTDLGEPPRSPPVLYVDNKAMLALCREHRLEHRTKHIALRYFLARELQQRGQLRLAYVASQANTADIFTKALQPCDHQRFCTMLGLVPTWPHLLTS
ncbi:unnamed protein product [Closterium sp. NIES-54]